jgi:hypothetical protein
MTAYHTPLPIQAEDEIQFSQNSKDAIVTITMRKDFANDLIEKESDSELNRDHLEPSQSPTPIKQQKTQMQYM